MSIGSLPFGPIYGSIFFGTIVSTMFYGVACMQTLFYYVHYKNDTLCTRVLVAILWALNTIHEGLSISGAYKSFLAELVNPLSQQQNGCAELILTGLPTIIVIVTTEVFLVYRIYIFSGKNITLPLILVVLVLVRIVFVITYVGEAVHIMNGIHVVEISTLNTGTLAIINTLILSCSAGANILIAISMTSLLIRHWMETEFARTAHLLQRLIMLSVNTGIWLATISLLAIILLYLFPESLIYTVFIRAACSIYFNTLLANLNARAYVRGQRTDNVNLEWFSSPVTGNQQDREASLVFAAHQGVQNTTEASTSPDINRSPTHSGV